MSPSTGDRAIEFARLLNFFDQLASRGEKRHDARNNATEPPAPCELTRAHRDIPPVHTSKANKLKDFYHATASLKTFGNLSNFPGYSGAIAKQPRKVSASEVSVTESMKSGSDSDGRDTPSVEDSPDEFPMRRERPFTFKLMLHKLYERDDWAKKVQEALEQSQKDYKPLSECSEGVGLEKGLRACDGIVGGADGRSGVGEHFTPPTGERTGQTASSSWRQRSLSVATHSMSNAKSVSRYSDGREGMARAVKKRCVGRRKSLNGPLNVSAQASHAWVYDAMISQFEHGVPGGDGGSLRGKGRQRSLSVAEGGGNGGVAGVGDGPRKRATTTVSTTILEGTGRENLKRPAIGRETAGFPLRITGIRPHGAPSIPRHFPPHGNLLPQS